MRRTVSLFAATYLAVSVFSSTAAAEEGLFVSRLGGGVTVRDPNGSSDLSAALNLSADLGLSPKWGIVGGALLLAGRPGASLGLGMGVKALLFEAMWRRSYLLMMPELLLDWPPRSRVQADLRVRAGLGYEEVLFWGAGLGLELFGALPLGLPDQAQRVLTLGATAGLFMEF